MRDRLATKLVEERQARLQQMRDRLTTESVEEREARLQQMIIHQRKRLATKSAEEREARLQQMRDRLAIESAEEREARLQQIRDRLACVCAVAEISTYRRCAPLLTIWTLTPYHPSCRFALIHVHANSSVMTGMRC